MAYMENKMKICRKGLHQFEGRACLECKKANNKAWKEANAEKRKANNKAWKEANAEKRKAYLKAYYEVNKEQSKTNAKVWQEANKDKRNAINKVWEIANPDKVNAKNAKRRSKKLNATPSWLTKEQLVEITVFYTKAKELELETGIKHHVDHIIPLQGKIVSGLHVPWNLRIITATENLEKGNRI